MAKQQKAVLLILMILCGFLVGLCVKATMIRAMPLFTSTKPEDRANIDKSLPEERNKENANLAKVLESVLNMATAHQGKKERIYQLELMKIGCLKLFLTMVSMMKLWFQLLHEVHGQEWTVRQDPFL